MTSVFPSYCANFWSFADVFDAAFLAGAFFAALSFVVFSAARLVALFFAVVSFLAAVSFFAAALFVVFFAGAFFAARVFELCGYETSPAFAAPRSDIIQAVTFSAPEPMLHLMRGIQSGAPVDSFVTPEPWAMPGYQDKVIMAAGTFVAGASIELSTDAPMRAPYIAYMQGALTYAHGRLGTMGAIQTMLNEGLIRL